MAALHHVGLTVRDLDRSLDFYLGALGLDLAWEPTPIFDDPALGPAVGVPGAALRCAGLRVDGGMLELLEYARPAAPNDAPLPQHALGFGHVALRVDDCAARKAELEARGVAFLADVTVVDDGVLAGWRWVYFTDPDGNVLELVEEAYTRPEERRAAIADHLQRRRTERSAA